MARVFISYKQGVVDAEVARAIRDRLDALQHHVFLDTSTLQTGELWSARLAEEIVRAEYFVPLVSSSSVDSAFILEYELAPALRRWKESSLEILPVYLAYDGVLPEAARELEQLQHVKWRQRADTERVAAEIAKLIGPAMSSLRGALSFDETHAKIFLALGREKAILEMATLIRTRSQPHILLHGVSGAGKTSFLKAGVRTAVPELVVIELESSTPQELRAAVDHHPGALVALDQFEQVLIALGDDEEARNAFAATVEELTRGGARFLFSLREEYRIVLEDLLPGLAAACASYGLLPFKPAEAARVLETMLKDGRVDYDRDALRPLCDALAEGPTKTVLPAILQIVVEHCRTTRSRVTAATRDDLVQKDRLFRRYVEESVLARRPRSVPELDAASTLLALTSGEVKSQPKTEAEIAAEQEVAPERVARTLQVADHARVVSKDFPGPGAPPRYRLAHDLLVPPVTRLHATAARRRRRRNVALGVLAALSAITAAALALLLTSGTAASASARREFAEAVRHAEQGRRDAAALHAARAFASAPSRDPLRRTYALASLHASLASWPPIVLPRPNYRSSVVSSDFVVLTGPGASPTFVYRPGKSTLTLPPLADMYAFAVSPDGRWIATTMIDEREGRRSLIFDEGRPVTAWEAPPRFVSAFFNGDGSMIVAHDDDQVRVWSRGTGRLLRSLAVPRAIHNQIAFDAHAERCLVMDDSVVEVIDLRTGARRRLAHPSSVQTARFSGDGRRIGTSDSFGTLRLWDAAAGEVVSTRADTGYCADVNSDGTTVLALDRQGIVTLWDTRRNLAHTMPFDSAPASGIETANKAFERASSGHLLFVAGDAAFVTILHNTFAGHVVRSWTADGTFRQWGPAIRLPRDASYELSRDRSLLRSVLRDERVLQWDLRRRLETIAALPAPAESSAESAVMTSDLRYAIVTFRHSDEVRLVDLRKRAFADAVFRAEGVRHLKLLHDRFVVHTWFLRDDSPYDNRSAWIEVLDLRTGRLVQPKPLPVARHIHDVGITEDGTEFRLLGSLTERQPSSRMLRVRLSDGASTEGGNDLPVDWFADDAGTIVVDGVLDDFELHDAATNRRTLEFEISSDAVDPDVVKALLRNARVTLESPGQIVVTTRSGARFRLTRRDSDVTISNPVTGEALAFPRPPHDRFETAVFSRDGRRAILIEQNGGDDAAQVWDLVTGAPLAEPIIFSRGIAGAAFLDDGLAMAVLGGDGLLRRFYIGNGTPGRWLSDLASYTTGMRLDEHRGTVMLTEAEHRALGERLGRALRAAARRDADARYALEQLGW